MTHIFAFIAFGAGLDKPHPTGSIASDLIWDKLKKSIHGLFQFASALLLRRNRAR